MADHVDRANDHYEFLMDNNLKRLSNQFDTPSNYKCDECGDDIPEQRRKIGGVKYCISCQTHMENKR